MSSKDTRFKKGQSGNPRGRPKGAKNAQTFAADFLSEANEQIAVSINGRPQTMTIVRAGMKQLLGKAAAGDLPAIKHVLERLEKLEADARRSAPQEAFNFTERDREIINYVYAELTAEAHPASSDPVARDVQPDGEHAFEPGRERDADAQSEDEGSVSN